MKGLGWRLGCAVLEGGRLDGALGELRASVGGRGGHLGCLAETSIRRESISVHLSTPMQTQRISS